MLPRGTASLCVEAARLAIVSIRSTLVVSSNVQEPVYGFEARTMSAEQRCTPKPHRPVFESDSRSFVDSAAMSVSNLIVREYL